MLYIVNRVEPFVASRTTCGDGHSTAFRFAIPESSEGYVPLNYQQNFISQYIDWHLSHLYTSCHSFWQTERLEFPDVGVN